MNVPDSVSDAAIKNLSSSFSPNFRMSVRSYSRLLSCYQTTFQSNLGSVYYSQLKVLIPGGDRCPQQLVRHDGSHGGRPHGLSLLPDPGTVVAVQL
jgi:hypothetical protein